MKLILKLISINQLQILLIKIFRIIKRTLNIFNKIYLAFYKQEITLFLKQIKTKHKYKKTKSTNKLKKHFKPRNTKLSKK